MAIRFILIVYVLSIIMLRYIHIHWMRYAMYFGCVADEQLLNLDRICCVDASE